MTIFVHHIYHQFISGLVIKRRERESCPPYRSHNLPSPEKKKEKKRENKKSKTLKLFEKKMNKGEERRVRASNSSHQDSSLVFHDQIPL
jgi:hypothetical protein